MNPIFLEANLTMYMKFFNAYTRGGKNDQSPIYTNMKMS
jgi:hypothetical protein